jgi:CRISPR-associated protein (TIGR03986 family)
VPLPERVFTVENGIEVGGKRIKPWEMHDRYIPGTYSGWIDLTIETLTPLYIRAAVTQPTDGRWDTRDARLRPDPYSYPDGTPAIPGSSLRGMVRTLVEILSFSKIQPVSQVKPFFRTVADDRIGKAYRARMMRGGQKPRGGILSIGQDGAVISPRDVVRVSRTVLQREGVGIQRGPNYTPPWPQQHGPCWVRVREGSHIVNEISIGPNSPSGSGWRRGTLVLTGNAPNKRNEFVFLDPEREESPLPVPEAIWERFHAEDQITQWQERAFPTDRPTRGCRRAPGHLRDGEPVFFLTDSERVSNENPAGLVFLGRAQMFRFPYDCSPADLVPDEICNAGLDLAEAIFGKVDHEGAIKGRVHFEDAIAVEGGPDWYEPMLIPQILSAPKPTTFQHYLTQDGTKDRDQLATYLKGDYTTIRGYKLYWHRWDEERGISQAKEPNDHDRLLEDLQRESPHDTQHTIIRPVKAGVVFVGRVRFENLADLELGALLAALELPEGCCHRLGMGKPLGLGSVRVKTRLCLVDRAARYRAWHPTGEIPGEDGSRFHTAFENAMLQHAKMSGETLLAGQQGLRQIARLDVLYQMLSWNNRPLAEKTSYMNLARFRQRPVLPTPHHVAGRPEPPWPPDPPRPSSGSGGAGAATLPGSHGPGPSASPHPSSPSAGPPAGKAKPVQKGQTRTGTLRRSGEAWVAVFEGDPREARIVNPSSLPHNAADGMKATFYIAEQSKRDGIKARFERVEE